MEARVAWHSGIKNTLGGLQGIKEIRRNIFLQERIRVKTSIPKIKRKGKPMAKIIRKPKAKEPTK